ncbi:MAG: Ig-like domain-containing protein [Limisphaerales bacterium]
MKITKIRLALALGLMGALLTCRAQSQIVSDDFDHPTLNTSLWTWSDPQGDDTYSISGYGTKDVVLSVSVSGNESHDQWSQPNQNCPVLLQSAPDQDFEVTASWETVPGADAGEYGFLVYDTTETNFLRFDVQGGGGSGLTGFMGIINQGNGSYINGAGWPSAIQGLVQPTDGTDNGTAYMRLKRQGDQWTYSVSSNGVDWVIFLQPVTQAWTVAQVGPYVGGQGITYALDYFFNDASPILKEDGQNPPPTVAVSAPADGAVVTLPTNLVVSASVTDVAGSVTNVAFYEGTNLLGNATASPWGITWTNPSPGAYTLHAIASDSLGLTGLSPTITLQVILPDTVAITAPANLSVLTNPASLVVTAGAADVVGSVTNVAFYDVDFYGVATLLGTAATSPYSITWNNPSPGWHSLLAKAADSFGYVAISPNVRVQIYTTNLAPISDDFNHAALNTNLWTWLDPQGDDTNWISGFGTADVVLSAGVSGNENQDAWVNNNCAMLLQNAVDQDFEVTEKWETIPGEGNGEYGFLVFDPTETNFLRFDVQGNSGGLTGYLLAVQDGNGNTLCNGSWGQSVSLVAPSDGTDNGTAFMRLRRQGDMWTFLLSSDGFNWTAVYQPVQQVWTVAQIGPYFGGQGITYNLDYFFNDAAPILREDGQAATPTVAFATPANGAIFTAPTNLLLNANVADIDSSVTNVSFFANGTLIGAAIASPFSITWTNPAAGVYAITAQAADRLGATGSSLPITVSVIIKGGSLLATAAQAATSYDLTSLGTLDWAYWENPNNPYIHKASGGGLISDVTPIGGGTYGQWHDPARNITWSDGDPVPTGTNDENYSWCNGAADGGWTLTVPADTTNRTLHVFVGGPGDVQITAQLSDFSAVGFTDTTIPPSGGNTTKEYAFTYSAASASQTLTITEIHTNSGGPSCDLMAAWLTLPEAPSIAVTHSGTNFLVSWPVASAGYGLVYTTNLSSPITWLPVPNAVDVVGGQNTVTVPIPAGAGASFYRLKQL